jgi:hypothetical protein
MSIAFSFAKKSRRLYGDHPLPGTAKTHAMRELGGEFE